MEPPLETVNVYQAKSSLSRLLVRVEEGEEIVIARAGRPVARLVKIDAPDERRVPGLDKGQLWYADDLEAPLSDDLAKAFAG